MTIDGRTWLMILQSAVAQITQVTVIWILIAATLLVIGLLVLIAIIAISADLQFGSFFVVALGIMSALIGFLLAFPLLISGVFTEPTQVVALLSGLFGIIGTLVGTYFGVKSSGDAREGAQKLASAAGTPAAPTPLLTVTAVDPQHGAENVPPDARVSATFSENIDPTTISANTFILTRLTEDGAVLIQGAPPAYNSATSTATFTPAAPLPPGVYQATVTIGVRTQRGGMMAQDHTWRFTVAQ
jgi:hypothetical protein